MRGAVFGSNTTFGVDGITLRTKLQIAIDQERSLAEAEKREHKEAIAANRRKVEADTAADQERRDAYKRAVSEWKAKPFWNRGLQPELPLFYYSGYTHSQPPMCIPHHAIRLARFEKALAAIEPTLWYTMTLDEAIDMGWVRTLEGKA